LKNYKSDKPCIVCGESRDGYVCYHHIYSRKSYPEYEKESWNLLSVCQKHHNEAHSMSDMDFANKYSSVKKWFKDNNWQLMFDGKYHHQHEQDLS
jgi:hypothetical protein